MNIEETRREILARHKVGVVVGPASSTPRRHDPPARQPTPPPPRNVVGTIRSRLIDAAEAHGDKITDFGTEDRILDLEIYGGCGDNWPNVYVLHDLELYPNDEDSWLRGSAPAGAVAWSSSWVYVAVHDSGCGGSTCIERVPRHSGVSCARFALGTPEHGEESEDGSQEK